MSSDEELIAIGRLVKEHQEARSRVALLHAELLAIGKLLTDVGQKLTVGGGMIVCVPQVTTEEIDSPAYARKAAQFVGGGRGSY